MFENLSNFFDLGNAIQNGQFGQPSISQGLSSLGSVSQMPSGSLSQMNGLYSPSNGSSSQNPSISSANGMSFPTLSSLFGGSSALGNWSSPYFSPMITSSMNPAIMGLGGNWTPPSQQIHQPTVVNTPKPMQQPVMTQGPSKDYGLPLLK